MNSKRIAFVMENTGLEKEEIKDWLGTDKNLINAIQYRHLLGMKKSEDGTRVDFSPDIYDSYGKIDTGKGQPLVISYPEYFSKLETIIELIKKGHIIHRSSMVDELRKEYNTIIGDLRLILKPDNYDKYLMGTKGKDFENLSELLSPSLPDKKLKSSTDSNTFRGYMAILEGPDGLNKETIEVIMSLLTTDTEIDRANEIIARRKKRNAEIIKPKPKNIPEIQKQLEEIDKEIFIEKLILDYFKIYKPSNPEEQERYVLAMDNYLRIINEKKKKSIKLL